MTYGSPFINCPVDNCLWSYNTDSGGPTRYVVEEFTPDGIDTAISKLAMARAAATDTAIREHLNSHELIDYVITINRLRDKLRRAEALISPTPISTPAPTPSTVSTSQPGATPQTPPSP